MKKGYTLIEVIISITILAIVSSVAISLVTNLLKDHKIMANRSRYSIYAADSFNFIEKEVISSENETIYLKSNRIYLLRYDEDYSYIDVYGSGGDKKLRISYYKKKNGYTSVTRNTIMENILDYKFNQKGKLLFLELTTYNGEKFYKCIGNKKVKKAGL
ncbi:hypothetical protein SH2C18_05020 [Clostridium sediminicola]|uniref:type II secretion system protein n=1 Tax=Clostridium sediminicola TaxID=3114879 RepID=UPI0031F24B20